MPRKPHEDRPERPSGPGATEFAGVGILFAVSILGFLYAGRWLDERLGTEPLLLIVGVFTGFGLSLWSILRKLSGGSRDGRKPGGKEDR